jgi:acetyl esterase/lipase
MIEMERVDPEIRPKLSMLKASDPSKPLAKALFALVPFIMPTRRVKGVTLTKERAGSVPLRVYRPDKASGAGLLWIHGGGLIGGVAKMDDEFCGRTALELGTTIVSVDYRLAPKYPFPAAHDDVYAGWIWFSDRMASFGVDPQRIAVGGQSAGGGLAAGLVQHLHDDKQPVAAQWLWTPMLDDRTALNTDLDSHRSLRVGQPGEPVRLGLVPANRRPPVAPCRTRRLLAARTCPGLPQTWLYASDIELFHDEVVDYAARLKDAGVDTTLEIVPGVPHAVEATAKDTQAARTILAKGRAWLGARSGPIQGSHRLTSQGPRVLLVALARLGATRTDQGVRMSIDILLLVGAAVVVAGVSSRRSATGSDCPRCCCSSGSACCSGFRRGVRASTTRPSRTTSDSLLSS